MNPVPHAIRGSLAPAARLLTFVLCTAIPAAAQPAAAQQGMGAAEGPGPSRDVASDPPPVPVLQASGRLVAGGSVIGQPIRFPIPDPSYSPGSRQPAEEMLVFAAEDRRLYAVDGDAQQQYRVDLPGRPLSVQRVSESTFAVLLFPGTVILFNSAGEEIWRRELTGGTARDMVAASGGRIIVLSTQRLLALSMAGIPLWELSIGEEWSNLVGPAPGQEPPPGIWLSGGDGRYLVLDPDGRRRLSFAYSGGGEAVGVGSDLVLRSARGSVDLLGSDGSVRRIARSSITDVTVSDNVAYLSGPGVLAGARLPDSLVFATVPRLVGIRHIANSGPTNAGRANLALHGPDGELSLVSSDSGREVARFILDPPGSGAVLASLLLAAEPGSEQRLLVWTQDWAVRSYILSVPGPPGPADRSARAAGSTGSPPDNHGDRPHVNPEVVATAGLFAPDGPGVSDARAWRELPDLGVIASALERGSQRIQRETLAAWSLPPNPSDRRGLSGPLSSLLLGRWDLMSAAVRVEAVRILADLGDGSAVRGLAQRLEREEDPAVLSAGLRAIGAAGGDAGIWDSVATIARRPNLPESQFRQALLTLADLRWFRGPRAVREIAAILASGPQGSGPPTGIRGRTGGAVPDELQQRLSTPRY